jgi:HlyD family secretion protein
MKKKIITAVLILSAFGAAGMTWSNWSRTDSSNTIKLSGNIELTDINIAFKASGKLVELAADEGSMVHTGMMLARIDQEQIKRQQEREQAAVHAAQSELVQLNTSIQYSREKTGSDIALRQAELKQAQAYLDELVAGSRPQEIQQAKAALADARTQHEQASRDWERAQTLYKNDDISTAQRDQYQARFQSTAAAVQQAEEHLEIVQEGPRKEQIESARAQVERARAAVRLSEAEWFELKRREQEVTAKHAEIEKAKAQAAVIGSQLDDTIATSPIEGIVLSKAADLGEVLSTGTTVLTLGDLDRPWVRGYITEPDLGRVKVGSQVRVTTDSYPGKVYNGRVTFIASNAEFTPKQIQTTEERVKLVYRVKIEVENPGHELKLNMPVDAEIVLSER